MWTFTTMCSFGLTLKNEGVIDIFTVVFHAVKARDTSNLAHFAEVYKEWLLIILKVGKTSFPLLAYKKYIKTNMTFNVYKYTLWVDSEICEMRSLIGK